MDNKEISRKLIEVAWNQGNTKVVEECTAADAKHHDPTIPNAPPGPATLIEQIRLYRNAFPDLKMTVDHQIGEGDFVMTRWTARGTHSGPLMGAAPTHRKVTVTGIDVSRFANGKIVETWANWDAAGLLQQIGVMPPLGTQTGTAAARGANVHK